MCSTGFRSVILLNIPYEKLSLPEVDDSSTKKRSWGVLVELGDDDEFYDVSEVKNVQLLDHPP